MKIVWVVTAILYYTVAQTRSTLRWKDSPKKPSNASAFLNSTNIAKWASLISRTRVVINFMVCHNETKRSILENRKTRIFIYTDEIASITADIEQSFSCPGAASKVVAWKVGALCQQQEILRVLAESSKMEKDLGSVVVASNNVNFILTILNFVATNPRFKWRSFLHATEWFAVTINSLPTTPEYLDYFQNLPDFVTVLSMEGANKTAFVKVLQKSRVQRLHQVTNVTIDLSFLPAKASFKTPLHLDLDHISHSPQINYNPLYRVRKEAVQFLSFQKSVMAGMRIPVALIHEQQTKSAYIKIEGNTASWRGFYVDVLNLLKEALDFVALPFNITDGGYFSVFQRNGRTEGIVGYLKRREAGLSTMAMVNTRRRRNVIAFVYPHLMEKVFYIMYRAHFQESQLGEPKNDLIDTTTDWIYVLVGPCVAMVVGIFVFLVNAGFLTQENICGYKNFGRLYDFPLYWVFQTIGPCHYQSSRILRASWGLFCLTMFTSYSAILTSNATAPRVSPEINNLKDLLALPDFKIGVSPDVSYFITDMKEAERGTTYASLWKTLCEQNISDSGTFSMDKAYHLQKVLGGNYAFLGNVPLHLFPNSANSSFHGVKIIPLHSNRLHITVPKRAFYKDDLERVLLFVTELGFIKSYKDEWNPREKSIKESTIPSTAEMHMHCFSFLVYIISGGVSLAFLSLAIKKCMHIRRVLF